MLKKQQWIMLPTNKALEVGQLVIAPTIEGKEELTTCRTIAPLSYLLKPQYIYILSDEEIKKGDWIINKFMSNKQPYRADRDYNSNFAAKIIASSDKTLKIQQSIGNQGTVAFNQIPQIREYVIKAFTEDYNKGRIWTHVNVEYEKKPKKITDCEICGGSGIADWGDSIIGKCTGCYSELTLKQREDAKYENFEIKLRPDNTVIVRPIKEIFTREEIHDILHEYGSANYPNPYYKGRRQAVAWFNENY